MILRTSSDLFNALQCRGTTSVVLIDVRPSQEYTLTHIRGSINVPIAEILEKPSGLSEAAVTSYFTTAVARSKFKNREHSILYLIGSYPEEEDEDGTLSDAKQFGQWLEQQGKCNICIAEHGFGVFFGHYPFLCTSNLADEQCHSVDDKKNDGAYYPCEIVPGFLYLGDQRNSENKQQLLNLGIKRVLNMAAEMGNPFSDILTYHNIRIHDTMTQELSSVMLEDACDFIEAGKSSNEKVFVHCAFGQSRSASAVIAYIMKSKQLSSTDALAYVKNCKEDVKPNPNFLNHLAKFEKYLQSKQITPPRKKSQNSSGNFIDRIRATMESLVDGSPTAAAASSSSPFSAAAASNIPKPPPPPPPPKNNNNGSNSNGDNSNSNNNNNNNNNGPSQPLPAAPNAVVESAVITGCSLAEEADGGVHIRYAIVVAKKQKSWRVKRRYQQFKELHEDLKSGSPSGLPAFPGTSWRRQLKNQEYLEKKQEKLNMYLSAVLAHPTASASASLEHFLTDDSEDLDERTPRREEKLKFTEVPGTNAAASKFRLPDITKIDQLHSLIDSKKERECDETSLLRENEVLRRVLKCAVTLMTQGTLPEMSEEARLDEFAAICLVTMNREANHHQQTLSDKSTDELKQEMRKRQNSVDYNVRPVGAINNNAASTD